MSRDMKREVITVQSASFSYGEVGKGEMPNAVFHEIDLELKQGELFFLMGRNGCGKSTLIDSILGIHKIGSGEIRINGKSVYQYKAPELAKEIAYVPQSHTRSFPYTVREIVLMGRTVHAGGFGSPGEADLQIVDHVMNEVGIAHLADRPYTQISGGEMQMTVLARALVQQTPLIIMDEPTAHLDFYNELLFLEMAAKFVKGGERTVLMAAHSPNQAFYMSSHGLDVRVGLMDGGKLVKVGVPEDVLTQETVSQVFGIEVRILDDGQFRQLVPIRTTNRR